MPPSSIPVNVPLPQQMSPVSSRKSAEPVNNKTQPKEIISNPRKRKRTNPTTTTTTAEEPAIVEQFPSKGTPLLAVPTERQPSSSPLSGSRISSPDSASAHKGRKLKLYAAEEKTDIIDYAKCIGNRAAGREFNVAESSIREWRKNEEKIRKQAEGTAGCTQHFEKQRPDILDDIDETLVRMLNNKEKRCSSWYGIAEQANALWAEAAKRAGLEGAEMKITMGWVSRFMRRKETRVPKIAPPIIATTNASTNGIGSAASSSPSMVRRSTIMDVVLANPAVETRAKTRSKAAKTVQQQQQQQQASPSKEEKADNEPGKDYPGSSRRKCFRPMRVDADCATLLTTSNNSSAANNTARVPPMNEIKTEVEVAPVDDVC